MLSKRINGKKRKEAWRRGGRGTLLPFCQKKVPIPNYSCACLMLDLIRKDPEVTHSRPQSHSTLSSRVRNHHFSKFAIFRRLNRAHQELSFKKKIPGKNVFSWNLSWLLPLIFGWTGLTFTVTPAFTKSF